MKKRYLLASFIMILSLIMPLISYAAPGLSSVSGQCSDGNQLTISGVGFGSTGPNIAIFDDFEGGSNSSTIRTGSNSATVGQWNSVGTNAPYYDDNHTVSGSLAFQANCSSGAPTAKIHASASFSEAREFFGTWWVYLPAGEYFPGEGGGIGTNWKQVWFRRDSGPTDTSDVICSTILGSGSSSSGAITGNCVGGYTEYAHPQTKGVWCRTQFYWVGSNTGNGTCYLSYLHYNGTNRTVVALDDVGINNACDSTPYHTVYLGAYGRSAGGQSHPTYDDFYVASGSGCRARVEIGNRSNYSDCTNLTICTVDSWSSNSIVATVRQGAFSANESAYVFVVDASGEVSDGYPVVIGSSGGSSIEDTAGPVATAFNPAGGTTGVSVGTDVVVALQDTGSGVDQSTIEMMVDSEEVYPAITGSPASYTLTYNPQVDFGYNTSVPVIINARDLAGNAMSQVSYTFTTSPEQDTTLPTINITSPTNISSYTTGSGTISLSGNASDNMGLSSVSWVNSRGGLGNATGTANWSINNITLYSGENSIIVTACDSSGNTNSDLITVTYASSSDPGNPSVSSLNSSFINGSLITINGSGFGTHPDYSPSHDYLARFYDNFESGTLNNNAGYWDVGDQSGVVIDNGAINRTNSDYCARQERGDTSKKTILGHYGDNTQRQLYISGWRWFEDFNTIDGTNAKMFRVWSSVSTDYNWVSFIDGPTNWQTGHFGWTIETEHTLAGNVYYGTFGQEFRESWHFYEILLDQDNDVITVWMDGDEKLRATPSDWGTFNPHAIVFDRYSHETDSPYTYTDDCYISNTQARVMLGNNPTFAGSNHREIQIPYSWSDNSVTMRCNQGSFSSNDTAYLYVIDAQGNINEDGYPINFSGGVSADTTPPASPSGISTNIID